MTCTLNGNSKLTPQGHQKVDQINPNLSDSFRHVMQPTILGNSTENNIHTNLCPIPKLIVHVKNKISESLSSPNCF